MSSSSVNAVAENLLTAWWLMATQNVIRPNYLGHHDTRDTAHRISKISKTFSLLEMIVGNPIQKNIWKYIKIIPKKKKKHVFLLKWLILDMF